MTVEATTYTATPVGKSSLREVVYKGELAQVGRWATNYALAIIFLWFGLLKFTAFEASGIAPLIMNSPWVSWTHAIFGIAGAVTVIGCVEMVAGLLIAARPFSPRASVVGGAMAVVTFLITLSFMFTTPGVMQPGADSPFALSPMPGQFLLKDLVLLCVSLWIAGASLDEARRKTR